MTTSDEKRLRKRAKELLIRLGWNEPAIECYGPNEVHLRTVMDALLRAERRGHQRGVEDSQ